MQNSPLSDLIDHLRRLQGVGSKSAQRLAFQIIAWPKDEIQAFSQALQRVAAEISYCPQCFNFSHNDELCQICLDPKRQTQSICVVASVRELSAIERTREYKGLYHVLHGLISPLDGIGPDNLRIKELLHRISSSSSVQEIICALSPSTEGEATTLYLTKILKPHISKISRLAFGLSVGADIDQTDELTLAKALHGRQDC